MGPYEVIWLFRNINWNLVLCYLSVPYMVHKCPKTPKIGQINKTNVNRNYIYSNIIGSDRYEPAENLPVFPPVFSVFLHFFIKVHYTSSKKVKEKNIFYPIAKWLFRLYNVFTNQKTNSYSRKRGIDHDEEHCSTVQKNLIRYGVQRYLRRSISVHDRLRFFCSRIR